MINYEKQINDRLDDIVLPFDATQRSQASMTQKLCISWRNPGSEKTSTRRKGIK